MDFKSYSQAGQDLFVKKVLGDMREGIFVDCGCSHPSSLSNTYGLETQLGWRGLLVDNNYDFVRQCYEDRVSKALLADGRTWDWEYHLSAAQNAHGVEKRRSCIDYLSLDCDEHTDRVLAMILRTTHRFRVLTVEHDAYRFGPEARNSIVDKLIKAQYMIVCADVCNNGKPFEVWAVDRLMAPSIMVCGWTVPTDWKEIVR